MAEPGDQHLGWRRPSACANSNCVEVAAVADGVAIRDGKDPHSPQLVYSAAEFRAFVAAAKSGEYDDLCSG